MGLRSSLVAQHFLFTLVVCRWIESRSTTVPRMREAIGSLSPGYSTDEAIGALVGAYL